MVINRRSLLAGSAVAMAALALSACTTTKNGSTTTVSLNVTKVLNYAQAGINASATIVGVLALIPNMGTLSTQIVKISNEITAAMTLFQQTTHGKLEVSYNDSSIHSLVDSILSSLQNLVGVITGAEHAIHHYSGVDINATTQRVDLILSALKTVVSVFSAITGGPITTAAGVGSLTEAEALAILEVR